MVYNLYLNHTLRDQPRRGDIIFMYFTDKGNKTTESTVDRARIPIKPEMITKPVFCHYMSFPSKKMEPHVYPIV